MSQEFGMSTFRRTPFLVAVKIDSNLQRIHSLKGKKKEQTRGEIAR
jgi:hypothetical protein